MPRSFIVPTRRSTKNSPSKMVKEAQSEVTVQDSFNVAKLDLSNIVAKKEMMLAVAAQEDVSILDYPNKGEQKDITLDNNGSDSSFEIKARSKKRYPRNTSRTSKIVEQRKITMGRVRPNDNDISDSLFEIQTRSKTRCAQNTPAPCIVINKKKTKGVEKQSKVKVVKKKLKRARKLKKKTAIASTDNSFDESSEGEAFMKRILTAEEEGYLIFPDTESDDAFKYRPEEDSDEDPTSKEKHFDQNLSDSDSINSDDSYNFVHSGELPTASYHEPNPILENRFDVLRKAHDLAGNLIELKDSIKCLNDKTRIVGEDGNPKLRLWAQKWKLEENKQSKMETMNENAKIKENVTNEECKRNLLDHIATQQKTVKDTLDQIESKLAALEIKASQDGAPGFDFSSTLQEMQAAMIGLGTLKKIAAVNATKHERSKEELEKSKHAM